MGKNKILKFVQGLYRYGSLESVLATISIIFFIHKYDSNFSWTYTETAQVLSMWLMYLVDHFFDTFKNQKNIKSQSSLFFIEFKLALVLLIILILIILGYLLFYTSFLILKAKLSTYLSLLTVSCSESIFMGLNQI